MTALNHRYPAIQGEFEDEFEDEGEFEDEFEDEAFLGALGGIAKSFLGEEEYEDEFEGEYEFEDEFEEEGEFEFEFEAEAEAEMEAEAEGELEDEFEAEAEEEAEGFVNPVRRIYRDAELMAHLAKQASVTQSEAEAEQFIGALVPLATRLIPRAATVLSRNAPALMRASRGIVANLRRNPATRRLIAGMPVVLQRTAQSLADQAAAGRPIDATTVVRTLGTMTGRVLRGPGAPRALRAVDVFNRRWHRRARWARRRGGGRGMGGVRYPARYPARRAPYRGRPPRTYARAGTRSAARRGRRR